jgi:hypothetical protein
MMAVDVVGFSVCAVAVAKDDWRRRGQEQYLRNVRLTLKRYQALTAQWEHEHCEFCWHKFLDPQYSDAHRQALEQRPDRNSAEGYTNLGDEGLTPGQWWICSGCFADFAEEFGWVVIETDPNAWPYAPPEPDPRPTVEEYTPPGEWLRRPQ